MFILLQFILGILIFINKNHLTRNNILFLI